MFCELVRIDSPSFHERAMAREVRRRLNELGFTVTEDDTLGTNDGMVTSLVNTRRFGELAGPSHPLKRLLHTGSDCGNLFATLPGQGELAHEDPILFITHLDTVMPALGKRAVVHEDGRITSAGSTVLGATTWQASPASLRRFATCRSGAWRTGLSSSPAWSPRRPATWAPAPSTSAAAARAWLHARLLRRPQRVRLPGAHHHLLHHRGPGPRGACRFYPERGVNAIKIAARAIEQVECGRIDEDTTVNVGLISGGRGTNVVPATCVVRGEVRSYVHERAEAHARHVCELFEAAAKELGGEVSAQLSEACHAYRTPHDAPVVERFERACRALAWRRRASPPSAAVTTTWRSLTASPASSWPTACARPTQRASTWSPATSPWSSALVEELLTLE